MARFAAGREAVGPAGVASADSSRIGARHSPGWHPVHVLTIASPGARVERDVYANMPAIGRPGRPHFLYCIVLSYLKRAPLASRSGPGPNERAIAHIADKSLVCGIDRGAREFPPQMQKVRPQ